MIFFGKDKGLLVCEDTNQGGDSLSYLFIVLSAKSGIAFLMAKLWLWSLEALTTAACTGGCRYNLCSYQQIRL
jgi:hypothetical protein